MKKGNILVFVLSVCFLMSPESIFAQVTDPGKKTEKETEKRINKSIDKGISKGFDKLEKGIGSLFKKQNASYKKEAKQPEQVTVQSEDATVTAPTEQNKTKASLVWAKYDFVPGDKIFFEDNLEGEENGEFPSRWDLKAGNAEVAEFGGEMVIMLRDGHPSIVPYFKDPQNDYLPDIFTIEFDLYYPGSGTFETHLYDTKNQKSGSPTGYTSIDIHYNEMQMAQFKSKLPGENIEKNDGCI